MRIQQSRQVKARVTFLGKGCTRYTWARAEMWYKGMMGPKLGVKLGLGLKQELRFNLGLKLRLRLDLGLLIWGYTWVVRLELHMGLTWDRG